MSTSVRSARRLPGLRTRAAALLLICLWAAASQLGAAPVGVDFRQGANQDPTLGSLHWINSVLNPNNSSYAEGMAVPQRVLLTDIPAADGNAHSLTFVVDASKHGIPTYDFLTSYDHAVATASAILGITTTLNPCGDEIGPPGDLGATCEALRGGPHSAVIDAPDDDFVSGIGAVQAKINAFETAYGNRTITLYSDAPISGAVMEVVGHSSSGRGGDSSVTYRLRWTSSGSRLLVELAAHLAVSGDGTGVSWGPGLGASFVQGAPYHISLAELDGLSLGNRDNQIMLRPPVVPPPAQACSIEGPDASCSGRSGLTFRASGATAGDSLSWTVSGAGTIDGAADGPTLNVTAGAQGSFTVNLTVSGTSGTRSCSRTVAVAGPPAASARGGALNCRSGPNLTLHASSDQANSTFSWSTADGRIVSGADSADPVVSAPGLYQVTVTGPGGCTSQSSAVVVREDAPPVINAPVSAGLDCAGGGQATLIVSTGTPNAQFSWTTANGSIVSGGDSPSPVVSGAGAYTVTVTDPATGCSSTQTLNVHAATPPVVNAPASAAFACVDDGEATLIVSSNTPDARFSWATSNGAIVSGADSPSVVVRSAGTYTVTVTDPATGCSTTQTLNVADAAPPTVSAAAAGALDCRNPQVNLTGSTSTPNAQFSWTASGGGHIVSGAGTPNPIVDASGTYTLTVTDPATGCTATDSVTVSGESARPICNLNRPAVLPACGSQGNVLMVTGNGVSFRWEVLSGTAVITGGANTNTISYTAGAGPSTFQVTSTGANGCTSTCTITFSCPGANEFCTLGPGLLGLAQCPGNATLGCLLGPDGVTVGVPGVRSLTIRDTACLGARFPIAGTPAALPAFENGNGGPDRTISSASCDTTPSMAIDGGRFGNVLLGQTILLTLSVRMDASLGSYVLPTSISTVPALPGGDGSFGEPLNCGNGRGGRTSDDLPDFGTLSCDTITQVIPASLVGVTVEQLLAQVNQALAGQTTAATLEDLYLAVRAVTRSFEGCRFLGECPTVSGVNRPVHVISEPLGRLRR